MSVLPLCHCSYYRDVVTWHNMPDFFVVVVDCVNVVDAVAMLLYAWLLLLQHLVTTVKFPGSHFVLSPLP